MSKIGTCPVCDKEKLLNFGVSLNAQAAKKVGKDFATICYDCAMKMEGPYGSKQEKKAMAKKATAKSDVGDPIPAAKPQASSPAPAGLGGALAAMKKAGAKADVVKASKSGVETIEVDGKEFPEVAAAKKTFILEDAKMKAAESRKKSAGEVIKDWAESKWLDLCRKGNQYLRTISLSGDINFGSGRLMIGKPDKERSKEMIDAGLQETFSKEEYDKYVKSTLVLTVAEEYSNAAGVELLMNKLGLDTFQRFFPTYDISIELRKDSPGDDGTVELRRDMAINPAIEAKVKVAMEKGLISLGYLTLTSQKNALAVAQEEILAEQKAVEEAKQKGLIVVLKSA